MGWRCTPLILHHLCQVICTSSPHPVGPWCGMRWFCSKAHADCLHCCQVLFALLQIMFLPRLCSCLCILLLGYKHAFSGTFWSSWGCFCHWWMCLLHWSPSVNVQQCSLFLFFCPGIVFMLGGLLLSCFWHHLCLHPAFLSCFEFTLCSTRAHSLPTPPPLFFVSILLTNCSLFCVAFGCSWCILEISLHKSCGFVFLSSGSQNIPHVYTYFLLSATTLLLVFKFWLSVTCSTH